jgi:hypothetical protein
MHLGRLAGAILLIVGAWLEYRLDQKKTRRPLEEQRAQGLEHLLNASVRNGTPEPKSAASSDTPGRLPLQEAVGSEPVMMFLAELDEPRSGYLFLSGS